MSAEVYIKLKKLLRKHGPQEFGRISQALLELTLQKAGFATRGRQVERPDITCRRDEERYAMECKSGEGSNVTFSKRDIEGVLEFKSEGVVACFSVLAIEPHSEWIIVKATSLRPGNYNKPALKSMELPELGSEIDSVFPSVLEDYFDLALGRGSEGLRDRLDGYR